MRVEAQTVRKGSVRANGTQLYHEIRGVGPSVLFVPGASGDAEAYRKVADLLADEFTVVTYDRRGRSRSPRPDGWSTTSMDEQADDAAALLQALELAPAAVFGSSGGGVIVLNLLIRRPDVLRGAIVHEPPLISVLPNGQAEMAKLRAMVEDAMAKGGPRGAMEAFLRAMAGDQNFENLSAEHRERVLASADVFFGTELQGFASFVPDAAALSRVKIPISVLASSDNRGTYYYQASEWLASRVGTNVRELPGAHAAYLDRSEGVADILRPLFRQMS